MMPLIDLGQLGDDHRWDISESSNDARERLESDNQRLRTVLYATARKYNQTYTELEKLKELHGYYKNPLPFLRFPREVRDQIYFYCLRAPLTTDTRNRDSCMIAVDNGQYPFKPPTPGLVSTNKQVYREATEILYSWNNFYFKLPQHLFDFEKTIGPTNCDYIREIGIWTMVPSHGVVVTSLENVAPCDYEEYQSHWAKALQRSGLQNVSEMTIETECINSSSALSFCGMDNSLLKATQEFINRSQHSQQRRRVTLCGFGWREWEKFPKDLEVITRQWPDVEAEIKAMEEELAEFSEHMSAPWVTAED